MTYPETRRDAVVDDLHGRSVADPYRWLEDPDADDTRAWVSAQNEVTQAYLATLPDRRWFHETMSAVLERPRTGVPFVRGGQYFVTRNDGRQNQDVWYVADTLEELVGGGRVLLDPNTFGTDGTDSVASFTVSPDGRLACYGLSRGGSDWQTFRLISVATGERLIETRITTKFTAAAWLPDSRSYVYTAYDHDVADGTSTSALTASRVCLHRLGQEQADDQVLLEFPDDPRLLSDAWVTDDQSFVVVTTSRGTERSNRLALFPILDSSTGSRLGPIIELVGHELARFELIRVDGDEVALFTDLEAPRGRVVTCDLAAFERTGLVEFTDVVAESDRTLQTVVAAGAGFLTLALVDASPHLERYSLDGRSLGVLEVPGGAVVGIDAHADRSEVFVGVSDVTSPTSVFRIVADTGEVSSLPGLVRGPEDATATPFVPPVVRVQRLRATSADGTEVPYFWITPVDDAEEGGGPRPTLLYGYGGFNIAVLADYRAGWSGWLAAGGALAVANLRGGGEFGTDWYDQGRLGAKQNVFDDFVAVAGDLTERGLSAPDRLAIHGRSNGGLLVGAAITQRPELFAAAVPGVGVLDMLRYHLFTIGAAWMSDYGDPGDPEAFATALAYSPVHNVRPGTAYPPTLVLTGDHDDRVVPLHSHKFTATLQHAQSGDAPILTRIEVATGHGAGKPTAMIAAEWADLLAFCAHHTGLRAGTRIR